MSAASSPSANSGWATLDRGNLPANVHDLAAWSVALPDAGGPEAAPRTPTEIVAELHLDANNPPVAPTDLTWWASGTIGDRDYWLWRVAGAANGDDLVVAVWRKAVGDVGSLAEPDPGLDAGQFMLAEYYDYFARRWRQRFEPRFDVPSRPWPGTMPAGEREP